MDAFIHIVRKTTLTVLIAAVAVLTFLAILSIWEVLSSDVSTKAIESMALISGVALMFFVGAALVQHDSQHAHSKLSTGWIILIILGALFVLPSLFSFFFFSVRSGIH